MLKGEGALIKCSLYIAGGSREMHPDSSSLLALARCTPLTAQVHRGEWETITSPLRISAWEKGLLCHPDRGFAVYVSNRIREGFRVGFNYRSAHCRQASGNLKSVRDHKEVVTKYIQGERGAGRLLGPFQRDKMPGVHVSPLGVIPKSEPGKWRLILDLSSPEGGSVNDGITKELCSLSYMSVDEVAARV